MRGRPRIAQVYRVAFEALDGLRDIHTTHRRTDDLLHVLDVEPEARGLQPINIHLDVTPALDALGEGRGRPRHLPHHLFDPPADVLDDLQIGAGDLDAYRGLDAGRQHIDAGLDRHHPNIGEPRQLERAIELGFERSGCHPRPPLLWGFELHHGLDHVERRRIGRGLGASDFPEDVLDLGHGADELVGLLQDLLRLTRRERRECGRHVHEIPLVELGHELGAEPGDWPKSRQRHHDRRCDQGPGVGQSDADKGPIGGDQQTVDGVSVLRKDAAADK